MRLQLLAANVINPKKIEVELGHISGLDGTRTRACCINPLMSHLVLAAFPRRRDAASARSCCTGSGLVSALACAYLQQMRVNHSSLRISIATLCRAVLHSLQAP